MIELRIIAAAVIIALGLWVISFVILLLYYARRVYICIKGCCKLLNEVRKVDAPFFDYLHKGYISSFFGLIPVPYLTINPYRFRRFMQSKQMDEVISVRNAKKEYEVTFATLSQGFILMLKCILIGIALIVIIMYMMSLGVLEFQK